MWCHHCLVTGRSNGPGQQTAFQPLRLAALKGPMWITDDWKMIALWNWSGIKSAYEDVAMCRKFVLKTIRINIWRTFEGHRAPMTKDRRVPGRSNGPMMGPLKRLRPWKAFGRGKVLFGYVKISVSRACQGYRRQRAFYMFVWTMRSRTERLGRGPRSERAQSYHCLHARIWARKRICPSLFENLSFSQLDFRMVLAIISTFFPSVRYLISALIYLCKRLPFEAFQPTAAVVTWLWQIGSLCACKLFIAIDLLPKNAIPFCLIKICWALSLVLNYPVTSSIYKVSFVTFSPFQEALN